MSFPKRIGIVWFQGEDQLTKPSFVENVRNWRLLNPEWEVIVLDDSMLREICYRYSEACGRLYDQFDVMHLKIDFGRYVSLWETVGMYVDMDCFVMRSLDRSHHIQNIVRAYEQDGNDVLALSRFDMGKIEGWLSQLVMGTSLSSIVTLEVNNAIVISSPHHPAIRALIDTIITENQPYRPRTGSVHQQIQLTTGPTRFNQFFSSWKTHPNELIVRLPFHVFEPGRPYLNYDVRDDTLAVHLMDNSWESASVKQVQRFYYTCLRPYWLVLLVALMIILYLYRRFVTRCREQCKVLS